MVGRSISKNYQFPQDAEMMQAPDGIGTNTELTVWHSLRWRPVHPKRRMARAPITARATLHVEPY